MSSCTVGSFIRSFVRSQVTLIKRLPRRNYCSLKQQVNFPKRVWLGNLQTMKLDTPNFKAIFNPELKKLIEIFEKHNYELRIAGGAVRDLLLEKIPHDIDFATTATPDEMQEMFRKEEIRMINNNGLKHGTVTARIDDKENFEVTTLRIDVVTDGRRAEVAFTKDWQIDANRRDLTINAMFLGFDGTVYDYFNGREDLKNRKVRFVGDPVARIQEDYLRILRYFRFYGRVAEKPDDHEEITIKAIQDNASGLQRVSGERIWTELRMILVGGHAAHSLLKMIEIGLGPVLGLPESVDQDEVLKTFKNTEGLDPQPMTRLCAALDNEEQVYKFHARTKLSTQELKLGLFLVDQKGRPVGKDKVKHYKDLMFNTVANETNMEGRMCELFKYNGDKELINTDVWIPPKFPLTGMNLLDKGLRKGPAFAKTLKELRDIWRDSDYSLEKEYLVSKIEEVAAKYKDLDTQSKKNKKQKTKD